MCWKSLAAAKAKGWLDFPRAFADKQDQKFIHVEDFLHYSRSLYFLVLCLYFFIDFFAWSILKIIHSFKQN
jgi:hypothetical protein